MPVPNFAVGEVLTAANMNQVGLWLVDSEVFTTSNSFELLMPNTFEHFRLILKVSATSTTLEARGQLFNGATGSVGNYTWYITGPVNSENASQTTVKLGGTFSTVQRITTTVDILDATVARRTDFQGFTWSDTGAGGLLAGTLLAQHVTAAAYDRIKITTSTGTMTGTAYLYGYRK
jgi:hypothetical protein